MIGTQACPVHVPSTDLAWAVAPRFDLGYRLPRGWGELLISYRFLVTSGTSGVPGNAVPTHLTSRFDLNVVDFDYANRNFPLGPLWEMRWKVGVRFATVFYDAQSLMLTTSGATEQRSSDYFIGAGPYAGLELWRQLPVLPGLALYAQAE